MNPQDTIALTEIASNFKTTFDAQSQALEKISQGSVKSPTLSDSLKPQDDLLDGVSIEINPETLKLVKESETVRMMLEAQNKQFESITSAAASANPNAIAIALLAYAALSA
jgi:hypothetical protein